MEWIWKRLAHYIKQTEVQVEFKGITEDVLSRLLHQETLKRLEWVELVTFSEELSDQEKIKALQEWFLADTQ